MQAAIPRSPRSPTSHHLCCRARRQPGLRPAGREGGERRAHQSGGAVGARGGAGVTGSGGADSQPGERCRWEVGAAAARLSPAPAALGAERVKAAGDGERARAPLPGCRAAAGTPLPCAPCPGERGEGEHPPERQEDLFPWRAQVRCLSFSPLSPPLLLALLSPGCICTPRPAPDNDAQKEPLCCPWLEVSGKGWWASAAPASLPAFPSLFSRGDARRGLRPCPWTYLPVPCPVSAEL